MYTTYHLESADEMDSRIIEAIKLVYKAKPITITVEEVQDYELTTEMKTILDNRLKEDSSEYLTRDESLNRLQKKYGI